LPSVPDKPPKFSDKQKIAMADDWIKAFYSMPLKKTHRFIWPIERRVNKERRGGGNDWKRK